MHPNPAFRKTETKRNIAFARERGFGILAVNADAAPLLSHIPFVLTQDADVVELHLVRSNPILRLLDDPRDAVIAVSGPEGYISPDWYGVEDQVPTWNYVAVHLRGSLERLEQGALRGILDRLSAEFEGRLLPKAPWVADKMSDGAMEKMMRQIVPCRLIVNQIEGTWKLNQNKPDDVRLHAADHVDADLAALMRDPG